MAKNIFKTGIISLLVLAIPAGAIAQDCGGGGAGGVDAAGQGYNDMVLAHEGGGAGFGATTTLGSATGAYQFTYATLKDLGYISAGPGTVPFGAGEWPDSVVWTGQHGVNSRADFLANENAQNAALGIYTDRALSRVNADYGSEANGVPITPGGAAFTAHMLGAGGYNQWASCGYQAECLPNVWEANKMTQEQLQNHLMGRMAKGAGVDPGCISSEGFEGEIPTIVLMPWSRA